MTIIIGNNISAHKVAIKLCWNPRLCVTRALFGALFLIYRKVCLLCVYFIVIMLCLQAFQSCCLILPVLLLFLLSKKQMCLLFFYSLLHLSTGSPYFDIWIAFRFWCFSCCVYAVWIRLNVLSHVPFIGCRNCIYVLLLRSCFQFDLQPKYSIMPWINTKQCTILICSVAKVMLDKLLPLFVYIIPCPK